MKNVFHLLEAGLVLQSFHHSLIQQSLQLFGLRLATLIRQWVVLGMGRGLCCLLVIPSYKHMAWMEGKKIKVGITVRKTELSSVSKRCCCTEVDSLTSAL